MLEGKVRLARNGLKLGNWPVAEVRELLAAGFLLPTDDYWIPGQAGWLPLSELPADEKINRTARSSGVTKAAYALAVAAEAIRRGAMNAAAKVTSAAEQQRDQMAAATNRMLEDYLVPLRALVQNALAKTSHNVETALRDEAFMRKLFGAVYDCLPKPVTRFVTEDTFIQFCLKHRQRLLGG
jgi:hypothetical protein